jgi:hypothetical protein
MAGAAEPVLLQPHIGSCRDGGFQEYNGTGQWLPQADSRICLANEAQESVLQLPFSHTKPGSEFVISSETTKTSCWSNPQAPPPTIYHYMEFHHAKLHCSTIDLDSLAYGLRCIVGKLSLQTVYQDSPMAAHCSSLCAGQVGLSVTVLRDDASAVETCYDDGEIGRSSSWLVEVQRRSGDTFAFNSLARQIIQEVNRLPEEHAVETAPSLPAPVALASRRLPSMPEAMMMEQYLAAVAPRHDDHCTGLDESILGVIVPHLRSDMYHEQRMGLEALVNATDTSKSISQSCMRVSKAMLLVDPSSASVFEEVVWLALGLPRTTGARGLALDDFAREHSHLALMALSNALHAVEADDVKTFVRMCREREIDVVNALGSGAAGPDLGRAYHAIVALTAMCEKVQHLSMQVKRDAIEHAFVTSRAAPHAALEQASLALLDLIRL